MVLGIGVVAASVYAVQALLLPHAKELWKAWGERARQQQELQQLQADALKEAVEALKSCQVGSARLEAGLPLSLARKWWFMELL